MLAFQTFVSEICLIIREHLRLLGLKAFNENSVSHRNAFCGPSLLYCQSTLVCGLHAVDKLFKVAYVGFS